MQRVTPSMTPISPRDTAARLAAPPSRELRAHHDLCRSTTPDSAGGDVRHRHLLPDQHRDPRLHRRVRRRRLHAGIRRQGNPCRVPQLDRADHHRRHLLLRHGQEERHDRPAGQRLHPGRPRPRHRRAVGVLLLRLRPDGSGDVQPRRGRPHLPGRHVVRRADQDESAGHGHHDDQRRACRRLLPHLGLRRAGLRHRRIQRPEHQPLDPVLRQLRRQPAAVGAHRRRLRHPGPHPPPRVQRHRFGRRRRARRDRRRGVFFAHPSHAHRWRHRAAHPSRPDRRPRRRR